MYSTKQKIRHSSAGRNPAKTKSPRSGQINMLSCCAGIHLAIWIPACAGMTMGV